MEPVVGDKMKVSPDLTGMDAWIQGEVIDVEHNPFMGLVISIKDNLFALSIICCFFILLSPKI